MSDQRIDFKLLAEQLRSAAGMIVPRLLPGGRMVGPEWTCGDMTGGPGNSMKVNMNSGVWCDFSTGEKGGDIISLKAAIDRCSMLEAAKSLVGEVSHHVTVPQTAPPAVEPEPMPVKPPVNAPRPDFGQASGVWCYRDKTGAPLFYIARYDTPEGKQIRPFSWVGAGWKNKAWPAPRPLYGLEALSSSQKGVCIVEGEKSADAARKLLSDHYIVVTWPGGSKAFNKVDWTTIYGRSILIWPDADKPGMEAARAIAGLLEPHCPQVKIIKTDKQDGWDAADALQEGWTTSSVISWAKPLVELVKPKPSPSVPNHPQVSPQQQPVAAEPVRRPEPAVNVNLIEDMPIVDESTASFWTRVGMPVTTKGQPIVNVHSVSLLMAALPEFKGMFWYDEFHQKYYTTMPMPRSTGFVMRDVREFSQVDNLYLLKFFQSNIGLSKLSDDMLYKAVIMYSQMNTRNEVKEWFDSLKWDGIERLSHFFPECYGAQENEYTMAAGRNFWTGMVARVYRPGCQLDTMVVLEGGQGIYKSQSLKAIGGKWYTEISTAVDRQDFYQVLHGNILLEIAELNAFSKADVTKIKQVISCQTDRYRAPYARGPENHPRQSVFVGTTNESHWLRDHTGGRRFWPIRCKNIALQKIKDDREQLFAEAVVRYKAGEDWYKMPKDLTSDEQEQRREVDEWQDRIEDYVCRPGNPGYCMVLEIAENALKFDAKNVDSRVQRRIATVLSVIGWEKSTKRYGDKLKRVWRPKIGGHGDLFTEDLQDLGIEGAEGDLQT